MVNMDMLEILGRSKKFHVIENASVSIQDFQQRRTSRTKGYQKTCIPEHLFTDLELATILQEGTTSASQELSKFSRV